MIAAGSCKKAVPPADEELKRQVVKIRGAENREWPGRVKSIICTGVVVVP